MFVAITGLMLVAIDSQDLPGPRRQSVTGGASMSSKKTPAAPAEEAALYQELVRSVPDVELKGAAMPYTSLNGNMFSFLDKDGTMALRLPADARQQFIERYQTRLHEAYGTVQKEYVDIPGPLLRDTSQLREFFLASLDYARALKPKPTKR